MIEFFHTFTPSAVAFTLGPFTVWWYGIGYLIGISAGFALVSRIARRKGMSREALWDVVFWVVIAGLVGARLWYIAVIDLPYYLKNPLEIPQLWHGGMAIHGALVGGLLALVRWCRKKGERIWRWTDVLVPGVVVGQIIGRFGNWANQELYGLPTERPLSIPIDLAHRVSGFESYTHFHPMFLYEAILNAALFVVLLVLHRRPHRPGAITFAYLLGYGVIRSVLDPFRLDPVLMVGPLRITTLTSIIMIVLVLCYGGYRYSAAKHFREHA